MAGQGRKSLYSFADTIELWERVAKAYRRSSALYGPGARQLAAERLGCAPSTVTDMVGPNGFRHPMLLTKLAPLLGVKLPPYGQKQ